MNAYQPFLLPLAGPDDATPAPHAPVASPLEEEAAVLKIPFDRRPGWPELDRRAQNAYGLPLLVEEDALVRPARPAAALGRTPPGRFLVARHGDREWFVLEHPSALPLFDAWARGTQRPALARPSLFAQWWAACETPPGPADEPSAAVMEQDSNSLAALHAWLEERVEACRPSDWHLEPGRDGYLSRLRVDGRLCADEILPRDKGEWLVQSIISRTGHHGTAPGRPLEGRFTLPMGGGDSLPLRVSIVPGLHGRALVVRFLYPAQPGLDHLGQLGLREAEIHRLRAEFAAGEGLWLVAGPTGSGKSTTLHALLHGSVGRREKVLAVEDPVERTLAGVQHVSVGHPPGMTFARALRAFLRQAPDCLMIGEIRDPETAGIALQAARAGHRVLSSIHARDKAGVLRRFEDLDQPGHLLSPVCRLLIHQRLVPLLCPDCAQRAPLPPGLKHALVPFNRPVPAWTAVARGCQRCRDGYRGRTAVFSIGTLDGPDTTRDDLLSAAWDHLLRGVVDLPAVQPLAPASLRDVLRFATPDLSVTTELT